MEEINFPPNFLSDKETLGIVLAVRTHKNNLKPEHYQMLSNEDLIELTVHVKEGSRYDEEAKKAFQAYLVKAKLLTIQELLADYKSLQHFFPGLGEYGLINIIKEKCGDDRGLWIDVLRGSKQKNLFELEKEATRSLGQFA